MPLSINVPDTLDVIRHSPVDGVEIADASGHVDIKIQCQFGTLSMSLEHMPTGCHINGNNTNTVTSGGQVADLNNILTTLTYYYPECYQPDSIMFEATEKSPEPSAQAATPYKVEIKVQELPSC